MTLMERFWTKTTTPTADLDDCWFWQGALDSKGYGQFVLDGKLAGSHRVAYELVIGPIPETLVIDHLCRNPRCVNPWHLEPVTSEENTLRGFGPSALNARKTHCPQSHLLSGENLYEMSDGRRGCRECRREAARRYRIKKEAVMS